MSKLSEDQVDAILQAARPPPPLSGGLLPGCHRRRSPTSTTLAMASLTGSLATCSGNIGTRPRSTTHHARHRRGDTPWRSGARRSSTASVSDWRSTPHAGRVHDLGARIGERCTIDGRRQYVLRPLFPGYLFLAIELQWHAARTAPGVARLVMDGERPARVPIGSSPS